MLSKIKTVVNGLLGLVGLELRRAARKGSSIQVDNSQKWLSDLNFATILDIGANEGQFAEKMRKILPASFIYSFEPIPSVYQVLTSKFNSDLNFKALNFALGEKTDDTQIYLNEYSPSSSLLKMKDEHKRHFDFAKNETPVSIRIERLDNIAPGLELTKPVLVKIDVQGFEAQVINGGLNTLKEVDMVIMEVSFIELYESQVLFDEMYEKMKSLGFRYSGNYEQLISPEDGSILQADAIFLK